MQYLEVLVRKAGAVDGLAAGSISAGEISALEHELRNYAVEDGALVMERLSGGSSALLSRAQGTEVLLDNIQASGQHTVV